jgi:hypothetical protein
MIKFKTYKLGFTKLETKILDIIIFAYAFVIVSAISVSTIAYFW